MCWRIWRQTPRLHSYGDRKPDGGVCINAVQTCKGRFMRGTSRILSAQRSVSVRVSRMPTRAYLREYPEPEFIAEVKEAFPEKPIANAEEARVR